MALTLFMQPLGGTLSMRWDETGLRIIMVLGIHVVGFTFMRPLPPAILRVSSLNGGGGRWHPTNYTTPSHVTRKGELVGGCKTSAMNILCHTREGQKGKAFVVAIARGCSSSPPSTTVSNKGWSIFDLHRRHSWAAVRWEKWRIWRFKYVLFCPHNCDAVCECVRAGNFLCDFVGGKLSSWWRREVEGLLNWSKLIVLDNGTFIDAEGFRKGGKKQVIDWSLWTRKECRVNVL